MPQSYPDKVQDLFGLQGKVALILGGGLGMGEACAKWLAHAGCDVIIAEIIPERAARVAAEIRAMGRRAHEAVGDFCDPVQVNRLLPQAEAALGGVDIMVSIIGQAGWSSFLDMSVADWECDQRRNFGYFFHCSQWVSRSMVRRGTGGSICAIASIDAFQAAPMHGAYGAAKAGLVSLVKTMAYELGRHGVRVNAVAPGTIKTPRSMATAGATEQIRDERARDLGLPLGRAGTPDEIANAVLYLVSDMARYVTGVILPMDGGWLVTPVAQHEVTVSAEHLPPRNSA